MGSGCRPPTILADYLYLYGEGRTRVKPWNPSDAMRKRQPGSPNVPCARLATFIAPGRRDPLRKRGDSGENRPWHPSCRMSLAMGSRWAMAIPTFKDACGPGKASFRPGPTMAGDRELDGECAKRPSPGHHESRNKCPAWPNATFSHVARHDGQGKKGDSGPKKSIMYEHEH